MNALKRPDCIAGQQLQEFKHLLHYAVTLLRLVWLLPTYQIPPSSRCKFVKPQERGKPSKSFSLVHQYVNSDVLLITVFCPFTAFGNAPLYLGIHRDCIPRSKHTKGKVVFGAELNDSLGTGDKDTD